MSAPGPALHLLYGGTFDPIHLGHLAVARAALALTGAARLDFMPAADPPHRAAPGADFADRIAMLEAALASEPPPSTGQWGIDTREGQRAGPSYTVDTLREWRAEHGSATPLGFVLGADAFLCLPSWREWWALFGLAHLLVARRPGSALEALPETLAAALTERWAAEPAALGASPAGRVALLDLPLRPESATAVRRALSAADGVGVDSASTSTPMSSVAHALPVAVVLQIKRLGLYRSIEP